jgi:hypothetical protein
LHLTEATERYKPRPPWKAVNIEGATCLADYGIADRRAPEYRRLRAGARGAEDAGHAVVSQPTAYPCLADLS